MAGTRSAARMVTAGPTANPGLTVTAANLAGATAALSRERLYQAMFERGSLGQLIVDLPAFVISAVNGAFCAMTGHAADELVGSEVEMVLPATEPLNTNPSRAFADRATQGYTAERRLLCRDGGILPILSTVTVIRDHHAGAPVALLVVVQDLTEKLAAAEVAAQADRRRAEEARLFAAQHDPLTGLPGRSELVEHLNVLAAAGQPAGALLLLDLDDFHLVNDSLGHLLGDVVLVEVACRISRAFPGRLVAHVGVDEFAVVAPRVVDRAEAVEAAQRVHDVLDADVMFGDNAIQVSASVGIAFEHEHGAGSTLMRNADSALAHAKDAGGRQSRIYDDEMRRDVQGRLAIRNGLRGALCAKELRLAYQPIIALADRRTLGCEALLRWTHPQLGEVGPADFIPIAEQSGLIVPIGRWVMSTACAAVRSLHRESGLTVSVNVSVRQLVGGGFAEWVEQMLDVTGLPPVALTIEVTESALMDNLELIRTAFDRLRARGVKVAIDDFGTGYSSLARLQRLPIDVIKLDRAFVTDMDTRAEARGMAAAILQLSVAIGADVVAEGVETESEAATLIDLGYTAAQGYLFARPMPLEDVARRRTIEAATPRVRLSGHRRAVTPDRRDRGRALTQR